GAPKNLQCVLPGHDFQIAHRYRREQGISMEIKVSHPGYVLRAESTERNEAILSLSGRVSLDDADRLLAEMESLSAGTTVGAVKIDLADVSYMDSAGVLTLFRFEEKIRRGGRTCVYLNLTDRIRGIMGLIDRQELTKPPLRGERAPTSIVEAIGDAGVKFYADFRTLMTFLGDLVAALIHLAGRPREVRWGDVLFTMRRTGAEGLPIVALISFLIGLIIAFMSSLQLKQFGANIYVASLVSLAIVRELGPIMTAILVAGRSASAYAAEIGTMRINDEVDALVTMGIDPIRFLAVPKLIATVLVLPVLTLYADLFGIAGGLIVGVMGLDLTPYTYLQESQRTITLFYLLSSLLKALVFAFVIAWIGCQRGFQVRGGVEAVGAATTSAVVTSILLIVIVDSVFAVVLHYVR
ncbi:MAG: MlaE family lipid ABC transporter permease subunit, partial [Deltaproteobacteria bacterium]